MMQSAGARYMKTIVRLVTAAKCTHARKQRWPEDLEQLRGVVNQWQSAQDLR